METQRGYVPIPEGTDLNKVFEQLQQQQQQQEHQRSQELVQRAVARSTAQQTYKTTIRKKVEENPILVAILEKLEPIDFAEMFADRKANNMEGFIQMQIVQAIREQQGKKEDIYKEWGLIKEERKLFPSILKKILYIIENLIEVAESLGYGIITRNGVAYLYNGVMWDAVDRTLMGTFLEMAAERCGLDVDDARLARYKAMFNEQLHDTASFLDTDDSDENMNINMKNGVLCFNSKSVLLKEHNRELYFTYVLKFDYDESAQCLKFQAYLDRVLPDKEQQAVLQEYLGYCLSGNYLKLEKALMLYGPLGSGGKSVLHDCLELMFNRQLMSNYSLSEISKENYRYNLRDKLINYSSEIDFSNANMEIFKQLTSCETVSARKLYEMPVGITPKVKQIYNANELPDANMSDAVFRRLIILPFTVVIPEKEANVHLAKELATEESSGIFNWIVEGLKRLAERGRFDIPESLQKIVNQYKYDSVNINTFIDEEGYRPGDGEKVSLRDVYKNYSEFVKDCGFRRFSLKNFATHLRKLGFRVEKSTGNKAYVWFDRTNDYENEPISTSYLNF